MILFQKKWQKGETKEFGERNMWNGGKQRPRNMVGDGKHAAGVTT